MNEAPEMTNPVFESETRQALHRIRNDMEVINTRSELALLKAERTDQKVDRLATMMEEHNIVCAENKKEVQELIEILRTGKTIKSGAQMLREFVVWVSPLAVAAAAIWKLGG